MFGLIVLVIIALCILEWGAEAIDDYFKYRQPRVSTSKKDLATKDSCSNM